MPRIAPLALPYALVDAFTGSATGGRAALAYRHGWIKKKSFIAEQGHWMGRPGRAEVTLEGPPHDIRAVSVAGDAVTTVTGTLRV